MRRPVIMRAVRVCAAAALLVAFLGITAPAALAAPAPALTNGALAAPGGTVVCTVTDPRAVELSGLIATPTGYVSMNDSRDDPDEIRIFYLNQQCGVTKTVGYPTAARDPEDIAQAPDGTLWSADIGDNGASRGTIALWQVPKSGGAPVIYRLTYPDGPHDAEALFFTPAGVPVIVTKELRGLAGIYEPTRTMQPRTAAGVPMKRVGEFAPAPAGRSNPLGMLGEILVTGAATSPDRHLVALRTYAAAYEWDVPDGDPVKAITTTEPRVTPLPDEPQGEGLSYTVDGSAFLTVSDEPGPTALRRYARSTTKAGSATATPPATTGAGAGAGAGTNSSPPALARTLEKIPGWAMIAVAVGGLSLAGVGLFGLLRSRRRA